MRDGKPVTLHALEDAEGEWETEGDRTTDTRCGKTLGREIREWMPISYNFPAVSHLFYEGKCGHVGCKPWLRELADWAKPPKTEPEKEKETDKETNEIKEYDDQEDSSSDGLSDSDDSSGDSSGQTATEKAEEEGDEEDQGDTDRKAVSPKVAIVENIGDDIADKKADDIAEKKDDDEDMSEEDNFSEWPWDKEVVAMCDAKQLPETNKDNWWD